jgi:2-polyprenyl-6-methoxyphenol hydroxylase-like FAD-dependent oxidoreductase
LPAATLAELVRARLARCTGVIARRRDQSSNSSLVVYRPLQALFVPSPRHKGRIVLIGDAVHATTPHLGQGAAPVAELLEAFMQRRYAGCKLIPDPSL